jgi:hypothetical protein
MPFLKTAWTRFWSWKAGTETLRMPEGLRRMRDELINKG